jgi:DNA-binding transcriptional ArsR family regulator
VKADLEGNTDKVLRFIQEKPGCHLRQIQKELDISVGSVQYQLARLEEMLKITSARRGSYKFYFPYGIFKDNEKNILQVLSHKEIYRILKQGQGRMVISDLVTDKEVQSDSIDSAKWCSCIDGALTKENYLNSIRKAGFTNIEVLDDKCYMEGGDQVNDSRKISSLVIKAVKE